MPAPSYVRGADTPPLLNETIGQRFARAALLWPEREALVVRHQNVRWTYKELAERVEDLAAGLLSLGLCLATASEYGRPTILNGCSRNLPVPWPA